MIFQFLVSGSIPAKRENQIKCCRDWHFKCWLQSHVCTEAPAALSRNQKTSANRAVLTLWPLTNLFWHMGVLGFKNQNERKVFYHFSVIAGWTCPYTQPLPRMHFGREFQINIKTLLLWCQVGKLSAPTEPWQRPAGVPQQPRALASKQQLEPSDESWVLEQQETPPCPPPPSHHLVLFLVPTDRESSGDHQPPRLHNTAA